MLTDEDRAELAEFQRKPSYRRIRDYILAAVHVEVIGSIRPAEQTALDLAVKEGVHMAFRELDKAGKPNPTHQSGVRPTPLSKKTTTSTEQ